MSRKRVIAYQPDFFGAPEKPCYAWRRAYWTTLVFGLGPLPLSDDEIRQNRMLGAAGFEPLPAPAASTENGA